MPANELTAEVTQAAPTAEITRPDLHTTSIIEAGASSTVEEVYLYATIRNRV